MTDNKFRLEIIEKFSGLITAGFGLVAALAWNTAIQNLFMRLFGTASSLAAQFAYAVLITLLVVFVTYRIGKVSQTIKEKMDKEKKENGE